jgi:hypothetical protein
MHCGRSGSRWSSNSRCGPQIGWLVFDSAKLHQCYTDSNMPKCHWYMPESLLSNAAPWHSVETLLLEQHARWQRMACKQ